MDINCAEIYLKKNEKKLFAGGKSGARVYDIGGKYVLKQIYRAELGNDELYEAYRKEAWWYTAGGAGLGCLPEVLDLRSTDDKISILMKHYQALSRQEINMDVLEKIMRTLASVENPAVHVGAESMEYEKMEDSYENNYYYSTYTVSSPYKWYGWFLDGLGIIGTRGGTSK